MDRAMWALTINFWRARGWQLIGTLLLLLVLPLFLYGMLFALANYDWQHDESNVMMHVVLTGIAILGIVGSLLTWLPSVSRVHTLPITTWKLVVTRSVSGTLAAAIAYTLVCTLVNYLFHAAWPYRGPLLLIIATYLAAQAVAWLTFQSQILGVLAFTPLCLLSAWWFGLRYEADEIFKGSSQSVQMWTHVTWGEQLTLLLVGCAGVWGSFYAARLQRMGSGPTLAGVAAAFGATFRAGSIAPPIFANDQSALGWREWRERGRIIPVLFAMGVLLFGCLWLLGVPDMHVAIGMGGGFSMLGAMSLGLLGMYLGHRGQRQEFPSFDGTRPITDAQWSTALLRNMAKSTLASCLVWILGVGLLGAIAWMGGDGRLGEVLRVNLKSSFYPYEFSASTKLVLMASLWVLACWTLSANGMLLVLLRRSASMAVLMGGMGSFLLCMLGISWFIPVVCQEFPEAWQGFAWAVLLGTYSTAVLVTTLGSFTVARRRKMLSGPTCWVCLVVWLTLSVSFFCWLGLPWIIRRGGFQVDADLYGLIVVSSLLMLALLPIAATPLAVAWNRHR